MSKHDVTFRVLGGTPQMRAALEDAAAQGAEDDWNRTGEPPEETVMGRRHVTDAELLIQTERELGIDVNRCRACGEPETVGEAGAEFGWFTDADGVTVCQRCGTVQR